MSFISKIKQLIESFDGNNNSSSNIVYGNVAGGDIIINGRRAGSNLKQIKGSGVKARMGMPLEDFSTLDGSISGEIEIVQEKDSNKGSTIVIECDDNLIDKLDISVHKGKLNISFKANNSILLKTPIVIKVFTKIENMKSIVSSGVAQIKAQNIGKDYLYLDSSASSSIKIDDLALNKVKLNSFDASEIHLSGQAQDLEINVSGASTTSLAQLKVINAIVEISGASKADINCENALTARLSGASQLNLMQEPAHRDVKTSGASKVKIAKTKSATPKF